ncbi:MAG: hypothetical protein Q8N08_01315, partial [Methanobacteriaceae archaeon]|nr:hypothetical protein [Methanobacteriaceae archaeon]
MQKIDKVMEELSNIELLVNSFPKDSSNDDLYICALGFEDRCICGTKLLSELGYKSNKILLCKYKTHIEENETNRDKLINLFNKICLNSYEELEHDLEIAAQFDDNLERILDKILIEKSSKNLNVTFDISSGTTSLILQVLNKLYEFEAVVKVIYTEALLYYPTREFWEENKNRWQELEREEIMFHGVKLVKVLPRLEGISFLGNRSLLIAFPTFKRSRLGGVIDKLRPSKCIWLIGIPHLEENSWRAETIRTINEGLFGPHDFVDEVTTFDYKEVLKKLIEIYENENAGYNYNVIIAPLGSKLQSLAVILF